MKKALSVLLAVLLLVACVPTAIIGSAAEGNTSKYAILSDGAALISETVTKGASAQFTVTLPAGGWIQYKQSLPGLIVDSSSGDHATEYVQVKVGDNTATDLAAAKFNVQLTDDATAKTDIVPVAENADGSGTNPGTDAMSWFILGSGGNLHYGKGSNTVGGPQIAAATHTNLLENGVRIAFSNDGDKVKGYIKAFAKTLTSTKTKAEVGLDKELYVRLRNAASEAVTYTFTVHSASISTSYKDGEFILSDAGSTLNSVEATLSGGYTTKTFNATVTSGGYIQFDRKLTNLIGSNSGAAHINIKIGSNTFADYTADTTWTQVQLTDDATAASDIVPIPEPSTANPSVDAMTWMFQIYNGNFYFNRGSNTNGATQAISPNESFMTAGLRMRFDMDGDYVNGTLVGATGRARTSLKTLADIGGTDGVYVRVRNAASQTVTYTIALTYPTETYTDGAWKFSDKESALLSTSRVVNTKNVVEETATVLLSGNGGYVQLDRLMKDLIGNGEVGASKVNVLIGDNTKADYDAANVQVQLTADKAAESDIVPVIESSTDPGTKGITWLFFGSSPTLWTGKGDTTAGGGSWGYTSNVPGQNGIGLLFTKESDGTVSFSAQTAGLNKNNQLPSTKTLAEIGGEDGVYVRIRNRDSAAKTYTIIYTYNNVFASTVENGTVVLDKAAALTGDAVKATVTANEGYQLKAGSLKYTVDGSKYYPITARVGEDESVSNVFAFAMPEDAVNVTAEFVAADAANHALLGAAYNIENGKAGKDMRFGSRAYRKAGDSELISCGNYLLLANGTLGTSLGLQDGVELTEQQITDLLAGNPTRVPTSVLNDRCDDYVDYTVRIVGVADGYADVDYVCVSYANYRDAEGKVNTVYSAPCIRSYNQLINAAK